MMETIGKVKERGLNFRNKWRSVYKSGQLWRGELGSEPGLAPRGHLSTIISEISIGRTCKRGNKIRAQQPGRGGDRDLF